MYIPLSMLWKRSELRIAAGKSTKEHFNWKGLSDGVKGYLLHRSRDMGGIERERLNMGFSFLSSRYQDLDVYVP